MMKGMKLNRVMGIAIIALLLIICIELGTLIISSNKTNSENKGEETIFSEQLKDKNTASPKSSQSNIEKGKTIMPCPNNDNQDSPQNKDIVHFRKSIDQTNTKKEEIEYIVYHNERYDFSIEYPDIFKERSIPDNGDGIALGNGEKKVKLVLSGINNVFNETIQEHYKACAEGLTDIIYQCQQDDWYVISWSHDDRTVYRKVFVGKGSVNTFELSYPSKEQEVYEEIIKHLNETFKTPDIEQGH